MEDNIHKAVEVILGGGIVIFPTDTAFGIGCRMDNQTSVDSLFTLRKRPREQATPVLVSSKRMALTYYDHPLYIVRRMMNDYWPGALTIIAPCHEDLVYSPIRGNGKSIGLRMPNNPTILEIINQVGVPILGPSANFHGEPTPYQITDLNPELIKLVDYVVPGECTVKQASTVIDCTTEPYKIIRPGAVILA